MNNLNKTSGHFENVEVFFSLAAYISGKNCWEKGLNNFVMGARF